MLYSHRRASVPSSRPARGTILRCHDVGAGCGSRGRGPHKPRPRAEPRANRVGRTIDAGRSGAVKGESTDAAVARRLTWRISRGASGPLITGRPEKIRAGLAKSRSRVISARHTPRMGGREKRRATPSPHQTRGRRSVASFPLSPSIRCLTSEDYGGRVLRPLGCNRENVPR